MKEQVGNKLSPHSASRGKLAGVKVFAPATVANLVCGFDVLGMALHRPQDLMSVRLRDQPGIVIQHTDGYQLPVEPEKNVAGAALLAMLEEVTDAPGFDITIDKRIKPGSGLGSSAASSAGVVVAANHLLGNIFPMKTSCGLP
ncbi:hypothetical protein [Paraflavitalea speifideaquila]|uniref:GHMP family kinase ATP-binding protein n=1 Tax=Paraflavitalea speifideaquila TaxID=3076558 RepID=UPI0028E3083E|nr:hypothetical protein [Paraflavitalea speifideiaquila]